MSRSNGPATPKTGWPSSRHPGHDQDQQQTTQSAQRWSQQNGQPASQGYRQQQPQGYAQHQGNWPGQQQNYHTPQNNGYAPQQYDHYATHQQPAYPADHGHDHGGYTPTLDPYPPQAGYAHSHAGSSDYAGYAQPQDGHHGYDQWQGQQQAAPDPRGYDLGSYMPNTLNNADPATAMANEWALQQGYPPHGGHYPEDDQFYEADGYARPPAGALAQSYAEDEFHDDEYEEEPPRRRGRKMILVLTALVGAVGVGGALAYGYNSLLGPNPSGKPPVIKSAAGPVKSKPADPGGKHFAYTDSKVMGRLGDNGSSTTTGSVTESDGTRRVQTVVVGRDGSITPSTPPASSESSSVSVPGLTLVDGFGRPVDKPAAEAESPAETRRAQAPAAKPITLTPPATPQKPVVIAKAEPTSRARSDAEDDDFGTRRAAAPPAKPKKVNTAALTPAPPARSSSSGTSGYVAVLASVPASSSSRLDALKRFADLQQQYGNALENKTPDVQEANLGDRGIYHRLVAGPPGSREAANTVCAELKSAGYTDCWVLAY